MGWFFCRRALGITKLNNKHSFYVCNVHKTFINQPSYLISARMICSSKSCHIPSSFDNMINQQREQAQKSVIIEVDSKHSLPSLCDILNDYGTIFKAYHYTGDSAREAVLIQYETRKAVDNLLKNCVHEDTEILPVHSRLLKFSSDNKKSKDVVNHKNSEMVISYDDKDSQLNAKEFLECKSVCHQLKLLYQKKRLDDLHLRLKFMVCSQIEQGLSGLFPSCRILPFGSSINGFGSNSSDLDMILDFGQFEKQNSIDSLYYQNRKHSLNSRFTTKRVVDVLGDFLELFFPCTSQVQRIAHARVPIVKFQHKLTNIECDLSFLNLTGFYMSELIYIFGHYDERLYPLVFAVRKWAKANRITQDVPGHYITNFQLSMLVIFFLQTRVPPILPSVQSLRELADEDDERVMDNANCTFLRDIAKIPPTKNTEPLGTLLSDFFLFYESFDFTNSVISLVSGQHHSKSLRGCLQIENPLETELNISKNVSVKELQHFCEAARQALILLSENTPTIDHNWGIVSLFSKYFIGENVSKAARSNFQVTDLFDGTERAGTVSKAAQQMVPPIKQKKIKIIELKPKVMYSSKDVDPFLKVNQRNRKVKVKVDELFKRW